MRRGLLLALLGASAACASSGGPPDGFIADYAHFVGSSDRLGASLASKRSIAPAALFAAGALLQINDADERLQADLVAPNAPEGGFQPADAGLLALLGSAAFLPLVAPPKDVDARPWTVAATNFEAWAWTAGLTQAVKAMDFRGRPNGVPRAFFSGHSSSAFSAATVLDREYGHAVGAPAYVLASLVGYDRIRTNLHYPGDVLVGAGVGILVSNLVYDKNLGQEQGYFRRRRHVEAAPVVEEDRVGFLVSIRW